MIIIVVERTEKSPAVYSNPRLKNPRTLHPFDYPSVGSIEIEQHELEELQGFGLSPELLDRIFEETNYKGGYLMLQVPLKQKGMGTRVIWQGEPG